MASAVAPDVLKRHSQLLNESRRNSIDVTPAASEVETKPFEQFAQRMSIISDGYDYPPVPPNSSAILMPPAVVEEEEARRRVNRQSSVASLPQGFDKDVVFGTKPVGHFMTHKVESKPKGVLQGDLLRASDYSPARLFE